uniref:Uncharacterized protein n=1 Tax=Setaria viridis TaxID=4556 RepID=A0A4U6V4W4_SETVI|nr:hypothetical protein SEVIR_4G277700v2 [Setaria viridis]
MAENRGAAREYQPEQPVEPAGVFPAAPDHRNRQLCLDAGRALALCGVCMAIPTAFDSADAAAANSTRALVVGFLLWIIGACLCLLVLTPAAPRAVRAGAAVASTVLKCLSPPV